MTNRNKYQRSLLVLLLCLFPVACTQTIAGDGLGVSGEDEETALGPDAGTVDDSADADVETTTDDADAGTEEIVPPSGDPVPVSLQATTSNDIAARNSISCNDGDPTFRHSDNFYYRTYDLAAAGIASDLTVSSVDVGIEEAVGAGGTQNISVALYSAPDLTTPSTLLVTTTVAVADQLTSIVSVPLSTTVPAGSILLVEVVTPDGQLIGNRLFLGSNAGAEATPSYIAAPSCGITAATPISQIGVAGLQMSLVLNVQGEHIPSP